LRKTHPRVENFNLLSWRVSSACANIGFYEFIINSERGERRERDMPVDESTLCDGKSTQS
jgi:hypothetical protein